MIRCPRHGIDKDVCDCIDYTSQDYDKARKQKHSITSIIAYFIIAISIIAMVAGAMGCSPQKRAANNFYRAVQLDKATVYNECGKIAPPINKEWDSTGYKQGFGEPEIVYVQVDCDSARLAQQSLHVGDTSKKPLYVKVPCPPCKPRVDTFFKFKTKELVNRATEYAQAATIEHLTKSLNKSETALKVSENDRKRVKANNTKIGIIIAVYLAIKVLMMWLGTKLPVNGIFNVIRKIF